MSLTFTRSTPRFQKTEEPKEKSKLPGVAKTAYKGVKAYDAKQQGEAKKLYGNKYFTDEHGNRINQYRQSPSKGPGFFRKPEDRYEFSDEYINYLDEEGLSTEDLTNLSDKEIESIFVPEKHLGASLAIIDNVYNHVRANAKKFS